MKSYKKGLVFLVAKTVKLSQINHKGVFTIANSSIDSNPSQYSGAIKACKKFAFPLNRKRKALQYYKLTDCQIHHLIKLNLQES